MSKGVLPKVKKSTIAKDAKINKNKKILKKDLKIKERQDVWSRRIEDAVKLKAKQEKETLADPLKFLDTMDEELKNIETKSTGPSAPVRPDLINPHLKRVVSSRGRKMALKAEQEQFRKVMTHPAFKTNPLGTIGIHLSNTMKKISSLPNTKN